MLMVVSVFRLAAQPSICWSSPPFAFRQSLVVNSVGSKTSRQGVRSFSFTTAEVLSLQVFAVTSTFSVFAYLWLIVMCMLWTPDVALAC